MGVNDARPDGLHHQGGRAAVRSRQSIEQNVLDALVFRGLLSQSDMQAAVEAVRDAPEDLESLLLERYRVPKPAFGAALSDFYQCPYLPYDERTVIDGDLFRTLSTDYLKKNLWLPISRRGSLLDVLTTDPNDSDRGWDIRRAFPGATIRYSVGLRRDIEQFLISVKRQAGTSPVGAILSELVQDIPVVQARAQAEHALNEDHSAIVRLANHVIVEADRQGASDIHIEPYADRKDTAVRFRVDGSCFTLSLIHI